MMENNKCPECDGTGEVYYSCCGDDVKGTEAEDYDLCPTCHEHLDGEYSDCDSCNGTGIIASYDNEVKVILIEKV